MKKSIIYLIEFLALQAVAGFIVKTAWSLATGTGDLTPSLIITMSAVSALLTIVLFLATRAAVVSPSWLRTRPWVVLTWSVIAALGAIIPSEWLQEQLPPLPNLVADEFDMILSNRWGFFTVGLLVPVAEELVMRGAILRVLLQQPLLRNGSTSANAWAAIAVSALFFAFAHMNPAQMPHAFLIGLLLGWMYWRTRSILPGVAFHVANNSVAYIMYNIFPDPDMQLIDLFGGNQSRVLLAVTFSLLILLPALWQLHQWMRTADGRKA